MANLISPGVAVSVIDESFYGSAGPGTVPLIVFATSANKASPTGTGIAPGTVPSQANKLYLVTSQRELIQTFGNPVFKTVQGTPVHGHELNEYGLHAAYQYLGISNRAYVMRADVDLAQLEPSDSAPRGEPVNGTYWFDLSETRFGIFQSSGASSLDPFLKQTVTVIYHPADFDANTGKPLNTIGDDGDFAVVTAEANNRVFEKIDGVWYAVGHDTWKFYRNLLRGPNSATATVGDSFSISDGTLAGTATVTITASSGSAIAGDINTAISGVPTLAGKIQASADSQGRVSINFKTSQLILDNVTGTPLSTVFGITSLPYVQKGVTLTYDAANRVPQNSISGDVWIKTTSVNNGALFTLKVFDSSLGAFTTVPAPFYPDVASAQVALGNNPAVGTVFVHYNQEGSPSDPMGGSMFKIWTGSAWTSLSYEEDFVAPTTDPAEGTMWYSTDFKVDIMVCDGEHWLGYRHKYPLTDPQGPQLTSLKPTTQSDGTPLVDNDLWIDTSDLENYPAIYRYNANTKRWTLVDNTDQTTPYGIIFADARWDSGQGPFGTTGKNNFSQVADDMLWSDSVDPDAPDPRTYSAGTLLFNTRFGTYNVKEWKPNWFALGGYDPETDYTEGPYTVGDLNVEFPAKLSTGTWVTISGNQVDGSPFMGRKAQRQMIVKALSSTIASNEDLRSELVYFNLAAVPGYPELIDELVILNTDQKEVAFIVGDTPARLKPNSTEIQRWATNAANAPSNGDKGLTTHNPNVGIYYPWGLTTNVDGSEIMVPPSTIALRTMAYNDQVAYPWFAPAGFSRGLVTNAASVGFLTDEGEYQPVILNQGQRDTLYLNNINPIAYIPNRGLVVYGQKTLSPVASAMDRVNVARLVNYIRYHLDLISKPFLFEQNDEHTRDSFRITLERFLAGLKGLRGLEDAVVLCDETNNTPDRRNRNELWADILIQPVKSVEFIYLPVRIRASGDSLEL